MQEPHAADYRIPVRELLVRPDERRTVSVTIDAETAEQYGIACRELPHAEGMLENRAGVLMFTYRLTCVPEAECDRCLSPAVLQIDEQFSHVVVTETAAEQNDAEYLLAPDAVLNLAEAVMTDLRLSLPTKILCSPDCKGLCPICGKNRNLGSCGCEDGAVTFQFE